MTRDQVQAIAPAFTAFLLPFESFFHNPKTIRHFQTYTRGLLSDLPRKTAEPLALHAGVPPRSLQQFLKACLWDHDGLTDAVQRLLHDQVANLPADAIGTVAILDETSAVKKGDKTPGVQRQYLGCVGKRENGIVTVHLVMARGMFKALLGSELYLPRSWAEDRQRCQQADIPDEVSYRPKWHIGLELLARSQSNGWQFDWLTFDEGYGSKPELLKLLDLGNIRYVGEVPKSFSCRPRGSTRRMRAEAIFCQPEVQRRATRSYRCQHQTGPASVWEVKAVEVALGEERQPRHRIILAVNRRTGEKKYFVTNAEKSKGIQQVLAAAFVRWNVEHVIRISKSEVGLTHFEGRSYVSLQRHLALCLVVMAFVALQAMRLRGEKSGGDNGAGLRSAADDQPGIPEKASADG